MENKSTYSLTIAKTAKRPHPHPPFASILRLFVSSLFLPVQIKAMISLHLNVHILARTPGMVHLKARVRLCGLSSLPKPDKTQAHSLQPGIKPRKHTAPAFVEHKGRVAFVDVEAHFLQDQFK